MAGDDPESVDVVYDDEAAPADVDLADIDMFRACLESLCRDSPRVDIDQILSLLLDSASRPEEWRRFYLNQPTSDSSKWTRVDPLMPGTERPACR